MSRISEDRFEELLGALLISGLSGDEREEFDRCLREDPARMSRYQEAVIIQDFIRNPDDLRGVGVKFRETENGGLRFFRFKIPVKNVVAVMAGAAAALLIGPLFYFLNGRGVDTTLIFSQGNCKVDGKMIEPGNTKKTGSISSSTGSNCTFLIHYRNPVVINLRENGRVNVEASDKIGLRLSLIHGQVMVDSGKPSGKKDIFLITDDMSFQFIGTRILARKAPDERAIVEVIDGRLRGRKGVANLEDIREFKQGIPGESVEGEYRYIDFSEGMYVDLSVEDEPARIVPAKIEETRMSRLRNEFNVLSHSVRTGGISIPEYERIDSAPSPGKVNSDDAGRSKNEHKVKKSPGPRPGSGRNTEKDLKIDKKQSIESSPEKESREKDGEIDNVPQQQASGEHEIIVSDAEKDDNEGRLDVEREKKSKSVFERIRNRVIMASEEIVRIVDSNKEKIHHITESQDGKEHFEQDLPGKIGSETGK